MPVLSKSASKKAKRARMKTEMDKWKHGEMHSGSKSGPRVTSQRQAIAISLHESGQSRKRSGRGRKRGKRRSARRR
jgi:hypothetical protein